MTEVRRLVRMPLPGDTTSDLSPIQQEIREHLNMRTLREKTQLVENQKKAALMETLAAIGRDDGGHKVIPLDEPWPITTVSGGKAKTSKVTAIRRQKKVTQVFDGDAALALAKSKGLEDRVMVTPPPEPYLDEDAVLGLNYEGLITDDEIKALYSNEESYSFVLDKVDA